MYARAWPDTKLKNLIASEEAKQLSTNLSEAVAEIQETMKLLGQAIQGCVEKMRPIITSATLAVEKLREEYGPLLKQFTENFGIVIAKIAEQAKLWQEKQKISVSFMAEHGWFPNWFTFFFNPEKEYDNLDDFMIAQIDEALNEIKQKIFELCPNRKHILEVAFALHESGSYIASIPLFLIQSDGICSEEFTHFFTKNNVTGNTASNEILHRVDQGRIAIDFFSEILLEPLKIDLPISQSSSKGKNAKGKGPNRHGIIHGSRKHLDYGSRINSYKAISFLAFIVFTTKDALKQV
jgi:hypothetical protein